MSTAPAPAAPQTPQKSELELPVGTKVQDNVMKRQGVVVEVTDTDVYIEWKGVGKRKIPLDRVDALLTVVVPVPKPKKVRKSVFPLLPACDYSSFAPWLSSEEYSLFVMVKPTKRILAENDYITWSGESLPEECIREFREGSKFGGYEWILTFPFSDGGVYPFPIVLNGTGGGGTGGTPTGILTGNTVRVNFTSIIEPLIRAGVKAQVTSVVDPLQTTSGQ
jgi:hypothetical protein